MCAILDTVARKQKLPFLLKKEVIDGEKRRAPLIEFGGRKIVISLAVSWLRI